MSESSYVTQDVIRLLNGLKRRRYIKGYAIFGASALPFWTEPIYTQDVDVMVLADTDEEYVAVFRRLSAHASRVEGFTLFIGGIPVQVLPTSISPAYRDTVERASIKRVGNLRVRVASREHLILLALMAFRPKDREKIARLLEKADHGRLKGLLEEFDDEQGTLAKRLASFG